MRTRWQRIVGWSLFAVAALIGALAALPVAAQEAARIRVAPTIVAADTYTPLVIEIGPPAAVPPRSFVSLRGFPPTVALTGAHAIDPGAWAVPLSGLADLQVIIPAGLAGQSEITISLIAMDGRLVTQARTTLVFQRTPADVATGRVPSASERAGAPVPERRERTPGPRPAPQLAPQERQRAFDFFKKGEDLFAAGNVGAARLFYERAADAGLAEGALALAATYDPEELARRKVLGGVQPDRAMARRWYERARELGAAEAQSHIERLARED